MQQQHSLVIVVHIRSTGRILINEKVPLIPQWNFVLNRWWQRRLGLVESSENSLDMPIS